MQDPSEDEDANGEDYKYKVTKIISKKERDRVEE